MDLIAGPWSTAFFGTPFLRAQTILQTQDLIPGLKSKPMMGLFHTFNRISNGEGLRSLWRGGIPSFLLAISRDIFNTTCSIDIEEDELEMDEFSQEKSEFGPERIYNTNDNTIEEAKNSNFGDQAIEFDKVMDMVTELDEDYVNQNILAYPGLPVSLFTLVFGIITHPMELIRTKLAIDHNTRDQRKYSGIFDAVRKTVRVGGVKSLYTGFGPLTLSLLIKENLYGIFIDRSDKSPIDIMQLFICDAALYPLVVTAHRMMVFSDNVFGKYNGAVACLQNTYKDFGMRGLYNGFQVTLLSYGAMAAVYTALLLAVKSEYNL